MNRKISKALGIAVCMLALAAPRAMAETRMYNVTNEAVFNAVVQTINNDPNISANDKNVIVLCTSIPLTGNYTLYNGKKTTIEGEGNTITVNPGAGIKVTGGETVLNLGAEGYAEKLTIDGNAKGAFITVSGGATAHMYENVTLQNRQQVDQACVVLEENSVFNMHGGVIQNCKGKYGGVSLKNGSRFIMEGGTISGCEANAGGGLYADNSIVTINKGTISGCSAGAGGGLYATNSSKITINNGTISGCKAVNGYGGGLYAANNSTVTIEGGTISECCTTSDIGMGGGLYAYSSTITISGGTIKNNKAIYGGGVALNSVTKFEKPITNWTVIGNEAYKTKSGSGNGGIGGGIYLDNGKDVLMDISDGSNKIYNNQAKGHGADICLDGRTSSIKLPIAANMGATYLNSGINIGGWYNDNPQYWPSKDGKPVENLHLSGKQSLVASYTVIPVYIEIDANGGVGGSGSQTVQKGTTVTLEAPTKEGHLFKGWKDEKGNSYPAGEDGKVKITVTGDMTLTAEWKKLPSAENLPKTGDESPVLLWGAALAVSAAACFVLRRKK